MRWIMLRRILVSLGVKAMAVVATLSLASSDILVAEVRRWIWVDEVLSDVYEMNGCG